jgi:carbonic anhydrase
VYIFQGLTATDTGSTGWAALAAENAGCSTSTTQSPIDVTSATTTQVAPGTLQLNFPPVASAEFENIGSTLEVVMEGKNASTTVNGKT